MKAVALEKIYEYRIQSMTRTMIPENAKKEGVRSELGSDGAYILEAFWRGP